MKVKEVSISESREDPSGLAAPNSANIGNKPDSIAETMGRLVDSIGF
jgi:hypothetical protein